MLDLPLQPRPIIGREELLAGARRQLLRAAVRLLTLTGPPGVGKTRMAVELAAQVRAEFDARVRFVDLAPISDHRLVIVAIARELGLDDVDRRVVLEAVEEFLGDKRLLLILDNFEKVLDAAVIVARLLAGSPGLKVVATSRAPLHVGWEHELPVPSLELPDLRGRPAPNAVAEICARLDGVPLAIELAAARIKLFPPRALLGRLIGAQQSAASQDSPLHLLANQARDLPPRQRTLVGAISWSYDLLSPSEQGVFRRLSVFVGSSGVEAAEAVGAVGMTDGLDILASLIDKSLVWREEQPDGEPRLRMLETIYEYAREHLQASDEAEAIRARHVAYYLELVERAALQFVGRQQHTWFLQLHRERDNLRAAERWVTAQPDVHSLVRFWAALWPFWLSRDDASESRERLEVFLALVDPAAPAPALAGALHGAGLMAEKLGDYSKCRALLEQSLEVARQRNDRHTLAEVLDSFGRQKFIEGRYAESRAMLEESQTILREMDDRVGLARVLSQRLFAAVSDLLRRLAAASPVLLLLDDLHAADTASLELLHYVARTTRDHAVLLLATFRPEEAPPGSPLGQLVGAFGRDRLAVRLDLERLPHNASDLLVSALMNTGPIDRTVFDAVQQVAAGNPLYTKELLRTLREGGRLQQVDGRWQVIGEGVPLPGSALDMLSARMERLGAAALQVLTTAAVVGQESTYPLLRTVTEIPDNPLLDALDACLAYGVLKETPEGYRFGHPLQRAAVYEKLSRARRTNVHGRVGRGAGAPPRR